MREIGDELAGGESDPDAVTVQEFATLIGLGREAAARRLKQLVQAGRATITRKRIEKGTSTTVVRAYKLVPQHASRKGRP